MAAPQLTIGNYASSYETIAASQSAQVMGGAGKAGDYLSHVLIVPATTSPGALQITDGGGSAITVYAGGTVGADLTPIDINIGAISTSGAWKVTTNGNMSAIAFGSFT